jgi:hypothetical protein
MTRRTIIHTANPPSDIPIEQKLAAETIADGWSIEQAAHVANVDTKTVLEWMNDTTGKYLDFAVYARAIRSQNDQARHWNRDAVFRECYRIEMEVLKGTMDYNDDRARRAADILRQTEYRIHSGT